MTNIIIQISKYIIILLMAAYTFSCFSIFTRNYEDEEKRVLIRQDVLLFLLQMVSFFAMYTAKKDLRILFIYAALAVVILGVILLYNLIYPSVSRLVVNNMCMLITAGMIMITRLSVDSKSPYGIAVKQLAFVIVGVSFGLIVPVLIRKMEFLENWTYIYAGVGGAALLVVALFAATSGGAKLSFNLGPVSIQPSEFVKILFVFYVASSLKKSIEFKNVVVTTAVAAAHVLILVISTDLGAALIYFVVYLIMLYVATRQPLYAVAGVGAGCGAAVIGYHIFSHIKVRVAAWQDPFATYSNGGYQIAYICAIVGGIANSFLDTGIYPAVSEIIYKAPGVATMGIKFFISVSQMLLPFVLGVTVATTATGATSYNTLFYACGIAYLVLLVLVMIFPLPDTDQKAAGKKEGLIDSLKHTHFSVESIAMILIGFTCTGTFQLWLNCAQNFAKENVGWADPSIMQTYYSAGTMLALVVTAFLTRKIKDVRFILGYPVICLVTMIAVLVGKSQTLMIAGAFLIGWAGAGGLLQIATSVCNMLFPKIKGTVTALVMIASSLCNYTILTAASKMQPSQVMVMNIVLTAVGVLLGLFVNLRYTKMVEQAQADN